MKQYQKMKDSGIEWIGNIPEHWEIRKLKQISSLSAGGTPSRSVGDYWENGTIPWLSSGEIRNNVISDSAEKITETGFLNSSTKLFPKGTVLIAITGEGKTRGRTSILSIPSTANQSVVGMIVQSNSIHNYFLWYYLQSEYYNLRSQSHGSVQSGLNLDILKSYPIVFPNSTEEQKQITVFLDKKLKQIDSSISKKEKLVELLQEKRQAMIVYVVTKGLDDTVPMKDSGIDWIGNIPDHWDVSPLGRNVEIFTGYPFESEFFEQQGVRLARGDNVSEGRLRWGDKTRYWKNVTPDMEKYLLAKDDFLLGMDGSKVGKNYAVVTQYDLPCLLVQRVARLRSKGILIQNYIPYVIGNIKFVQYVDSVKTNVAIPHMSPNDISKFPLILPPVCEQKDIIEFLNMRTKNIDSLLTNLVKQIEILKEYRQTINFAAVTGKIDLREEDITS
ncbi:putative Type-1 restriction enzyme MjaXIP specificity protein [Nitrosotalea devaniterrae]|uniref:Putative Type-1 restriction enzyme MjaXIP specificity protein n=1 Tax=Nitrosotalea devaniterrae TaxID=1078905 RepID=A0A128A1V6_9ARCH|nr:putative Type-1 restriction enzyme MjaXIP specificity protein [Candidatus Nitrosotalea devanaterra]